MDHQDPREVRLDYLKVLSDPVEEEVELEEEVRELEDWGDKYTLISR